MYGPPPEQLLADATWRFRNSIWVLPALFGCGMLTWISFGYIGYSARNRAWQVAAVCYALAFVGLMIAMEFEGPDNTEVAAGAVRSRSEELVQTWSSGAIVALWIGGIVHVLLVRRRWLVWRARNSGPWWTRATPPVVTPVYPANPPSPLAEPAYPPPAFAGPQRAEVDVNNSSGDELRSLGLSEQAVAEVLSRRRAIGGFGSLQEFAAAAALKPHELAPLLPRLRVPEAPRTPPAFRAAARRLDL